MELMKGLKAIASPTRLRVLELLKDPCAYCGGRAGQVDHIVSLAAGGDNSLENLTAACRSCNSEKRDNPLLIFLLKRHGRLAAGGWRERDHVDGVDAAAEQFGQSA